MAKVSNELIYKPMLDIQAGQREARAEQHVLTAKVGAIATATVSITRRLDDLTNSNHLIAVAVDNHTHQLSDIKTRLDVIEKKLDHTHA